MPDRTVSVRAVTLGVVDGEKVAVKTGLKPGEIVVTEGGDRLREGSQVSCRMRLADCRSRRRGSAARQAGNAGNSGCEAHARQAAAAAMRAAAGRSSLGTGA